MSYDKNRITDLVLELNSLLLHNSRMNLQYLPRIVDKLYSEIHSISSEKTTDSKKEIFEALERLKENDEIQIRELNHSTYATGEGVVTIRYNFKL